MKTGFISIYRNKKVFELKIFNFTFRVYKKVVTKKASKIITKGLSSGEMGYISGVRFFETKKD